MSEPEPEWRPHRPLGPVGMAQLAIVLWREKAARWETIGPGKWRVSTITFRQQIEIEMDQEADLIALQWAKHRGDYLLDHRVRYRGGRVRRHCFGLWKQFKPRLARAILHMVVQKVPLWEGGLVLRLVDDDRGSAGASPGRPQKSA